MNHPEELPPNTVDPHRVIPFERLRDAQDRKVREREAAELEGAIEAWHRLRVRGENLEAEARACRVLEEASALRLEALGAVRSVSEAGNTVRWFIPGSGAHLEALAGGAVAGGGKLRGREAGLP